jgi:hypothetical protein
MVRRGTVCILNISIPQPGQAIVCCVKGQEVFAASINITEQWERMVPHGEVSELVHVSVPAETSALRNESTDWRSHDRHCAVPEVKDDT